MVLSMNMMWSVFVLRFNRSRYASPSCGIFPYPRHAAIRKYRLGLHNVLSHFLSYNSTMRDQDSYGGLTIDSMYSFLKNRCSFLLLYQVLIC